MITHILGRHLSFLSTAVVAGLLVFAGPASAQTASALTGKVTSQEEGAMEGVLVSANRTGSNMSITVVSNAEGQYSFPRDRLEPGKYTVAIRAVGYELSGPAQVDVAGPQSAGLDLKLVKTKNLSRQLSNGEWLQSFTGTPQRKEQLFRCVSCHTLERIANSRYNAEEAAQIVQRMSTWAQGSQPVRPQPQLGRKIGAPNAGQIALGQYISTINLSGGEAEWPYQLKTDPRPTGKATRVIITEYALPRAEAMPHDAQLDGRGMVWYGDFGSQYVGYLDPKTGKATEYQIPTWKPGAPTGNLDIRFDRNGLVWIGNMMQGSLVMFDPKAEKFQSWGAPDFLKRDDARIAMVMPEQTHVDGKLWIGADNEYQVDMATGEWTEIDYKKMQPPGGKDHGSYGVAADSRNNFYGLELNADYIIKVDSKNLIPTYYQTPTPNSGPRRGHFDNQDRLWFAENRGQRIGMFDTKTESFTEWKIPTPFSMPYDAIFDNSTYAWTGGMGNDHVSQVNTKTGEVVDYLLPGKTNIRRVDVDKSVTPSTLWIGNNHGPPPLKVEPLEP